MTVFTGKILVEGHVALDTSPFKKTEWDTDISTLPAQTPMAFKKTNWDTDTGDADPSVSGFQSTVDEWA